jgi:kelch-like protein 20
VCCVQHIDCVLSIKGGLLESRQSTVTLQELEESAMEAMVDFFYSGKIEISELNVQDLLHIACLLQVQSVQKACCEFLKRQLSPENCIGRFYAYLIK